jgi:hypothetical protein
MIQSMNIQHDSRITSLEVGDDLLQKTIDTPALRVAQSNNAFLHLKIISYLSDTQLKLSAD